MHPERYSVSIKSDNIVRSNAAHQYDWNSSGDFMDHDEDRRQALHLLQDYDSAAAKYLAKLAAYEEKLGASSYEAVTITCVGFAFSLSDRV